MEKRYSVTGERKKEMVAVISGIVGMKAVYMRMSACAYAISNFTVSKEGTLAWDERSSAELVEKVLAGLAQAGFKAEPEEMAAAQPEISAEEAVVGLETYAGEETSPEELRETGIGLTVSLPRESFTDAALENLRKLVDAKATLSKKALAVESLPVETDDEKIIFPWFKDGQEGDSAKAYTHFITALCDMARHGEGATGRQREIRFPVLSAPARIHQGGTQKRAEDPAEEPVRQRQLQERGKEGRADDGVSG